MSTLFDSHDWALLAYLCDYRRAQIYGVVALIFGEIFLTCLLIKSVPGSLFVAKHSITNYPAFSRSCIICRCRLLSLLAFIGLLDTNRRQIAFTVCNDGFHAIPKKYFLLNMRQCPCHELTFMSSIRFLRRPRSLSCSGWLELFGMNLTSSSFLVCHLPFSSL